MTASLIAWKIKTCTDSISIRRRNPVGVFDTLKYSKILEAVGISRDQAEAHVKIIAEIVEGELATKQDVKELKDEMIKLEYRLIIKLGVLITAVIASAVAILKIT